MTDILLIIPALLMAVTFHEFAHGYVAYRLGDPTAKNNGRLTLNPIKHLDPLGSIVLLLYGFGWAKPVPVNPSYFNNPKKGMALVGLAGPLANILIAFIAMILFQVFAENMAIPLQIIMGQTIMLNIGLAVFNLIPIPPLDGSKIFSSILPTKLYFGIMQYESYVQLVLLLLLFTGILTPFLRALHGFVFNILVFIINVLPL